jgi:hypothetical protein
MHITVHAVSTDTGDGWVVDIPKHITKSGVSKKGTGWDTALVAGLSYMILKGYRTVYIFTTNQKTNMKADDRTHFDMVSWNYITSNQVDCGLRQRAYGAIWK